MMTADSVASQMHNTRSRSALILLGSALAMIACALWWGHLPFNSDGPLTNPEEVKEMYSDVHIPTGTPPPYIFKSERFSNDDDDNVIDGDDDRVRIRGSSSGEKTSNNESSKNNNNKQSESVSAPTPAPAPTTSSKDIENTSNSQHQQSRPKIVWLMSYPNSGTSYTMTMVARFSNRATATNYGHEVTESPTPNTPLYPDEWDGPYYRPTRPLPQDYILTKTHCGGRCVPCGPEHYIIDEDFFLEECRRGAGLLPPEIRKMEQKQGGVEFLRDKFQFVHYNASLVHKAIHLYRNPFHNIVSRFHLERKQLIEEHKMVGAEERYPSNATGFHNWCQDMNTNFGPTVATADRYKHFLSKEIIELMQGIPCHGEFFKYTQWHNHANKIMTDHLKKPVMVIHYENYDKKWNETTQKVLDYLHLERVGEGRVFHARHDYDPYFSTEQKQAAKKLVEQIVRPPVWEQIKRYFEGL